jgi:hypothetical protein
MRVVLLLIGLALCGYGLYCWTHMGVYVGTGHYWSNPWFYKAHACLFGVIAIRCLTGRVGAASAKEQK